MKLPAYRMLNYVFLWCLERIEPDRREEWKMELESPLDPAAEPTEAEMEEDGAMFMAALGQVT